MYKERNRTADSGKIMRKLCEKSVKNIAAFKKKHYNIPSNCPERIEKGHKEDV